MQQQQQNNAEQKGTGWLEGNDLQDIDVQVTEDI